MIDFNNASFLKLKPVATNAFSEIVSPMFVNGEHTVAAFQGLRDGIIFTNKRLVAINVQGMTGKKKDVSFLPYNKIQAFSVETAGTFDLDSELIMWFSGLGKVKVEFAAQVDIFKIGKLISEQTIEHEPTQENAFSEFK